MSAFDNPEAARCKAPGAPRLKEVQRSFIRSGSATRSTCLHRGELGMTSMRRI